MEEKNKKHKLTYEHLETVATNLGEQNAILYKKLQESSLENAFKRIEFLFKVLNFNSLFEPTFVKSCIEEIQNTMTLPSEESTENEVKENGEA